MACAWASGADWPTWRHDPTRSGACPEDLPEQLHLQWARDLPPPVPAWPNEPRLHFDASYEPVVTGQTLVVGSPNDGSVTAYDTRWGRRKWRFWTEGPVRFAPVAAGGRIYVGSDDGWLYCLDAAEGKSEGPLPRLLWKVRGAPADRPDRRHLGNGRLISFWPVRGGPVLHDGTVYFGAGVWPTLGVFVVAVRADTGQVLWRNGEANRLEKVRIDHNELEESGLSPQGYLLVAGGKLLVPNGRSMPAILDPKTGKLLSYIQGYRNGDCRVTAMDNYAFVGEAGVMDLRTGREVGSRWASAGKNAPAGFDGNKFDLFEGPFYAYKLFAGCSARSALVPGVCYGLDRGVFHAYDLTRPKLTEYEAKFINWTHHPWRWDLPALWKLTAAEDRQRPAGTALIKAGGRLYGHANKTLLAVQLPAPGGKPKVGPAGHLPDVPATMLAADGRLFVVTRKGQVLCFGAERVEPKSYPLAATPLPEKPEADADPRGSAAAAEILKRSGVSEGYCLVLGLGRVGLAEAILRQSLLKVIAVDADATRVDALRERLAAAGAYGTRAEAFVGDPWNSEFPPYLASLIVRGDPDASDVPSASVLAALRPYGGVACLAVPAGQAEALRKRLAAAGPDGTQASIAGGFVLLRRVGPLPGSAPWTHESADAARSFFSRDRRVKGPLGVLWYGDGADYGFWKHHDYGTGVKPQVVGGRVFALQLSRRTLEAYDAFTGRGLWKRNVDPFTRYASMSDGIYAAFGGRCIVYDPATGEQRAEFPFGAQGAPARIVSDIRVGDDLVVIATAAQKTRVIEKGLWDSDTLVALDRKSGQVLWTLKATHRFNNNALALGAGLVFCVDSESPIQTAQAERRGSQVERRPSVILALDARTGAARWTVTKTNPYRTYGMGGWTAIRGNDDAVAYSQQFGLLLAGKQSQLYAFEASTGRGVWEKRIGGGQPWILTGQTVIHQGGQTFDIRTGETTSKRAIFHRGGCNYAVANANLLFVRDSTVCYVELDGGRRHYLRNIRSGCSNSLVAADGLLNVPGFSVGCVCNYPIETSFAMVPMPEVARWSGEAPAAALGPETKPAQGTTGPR